MKISLFRDIIDGIDKEVETWLLVKKLLHMLTQRYTIADLQKQVISANISPVCETIPIFLESVEKICRS